MDFAAPQRSEDVVEELRAAIAMRRAQLDALPEGAEVIGPIGRPHDLDRLLRMRIFDTWAHEQDIRAAIGVDGGWNTPAAAVAREQIVRALPYVWARNVGRPTVPPCASNHRSRRSPARWPSWPSTTGRAATRTGSGCDGSADAPGRTSCGSHAGEWTPATRSAARRVLRGDARPRRGAAARADDHPLGRRVSGSSITAIAGSSRNSAIDCSARDPRAPSITRWSKESVSCMTGRGTTCAVDHPRAVDDPSHGEDRGLARDEDRRAAVDAEDTDVRQRDRAAGEVGGRAPARTSRVDERLHRPARSRSPSATHP